MKFIKVHDNTWQKEIYVSINAIESVYPLMLHDGIEVTRISTLGTDNSSFDVAESVDEVMQMIRRAEFCLT